MKQRTKQYWQFILCLLLTALVLAACSTSSPEFEEVDQEALITDADIDRAVLAVAEDVEEIIGIEEGDVPEGNEVDLLEEELVTQAVLPAASGFVAYIRHDSSLNTWQLWLADQATDVRTRVYNGQRQIQSVAVSADGNTLVFVMQRSLTSSDLEVLGLTQKKEQQ